MKIAILTQPLKTNYGGILQAYALQTVLQRMGHKVTVINRRYYCGGGTKLTVVNMLLRFGSFVKTLIRKYVLNKKGYILMNPLSPYYHSKITELDPLPFVKKYICLSPDIRTSEKLNKYFKRQKFDMYVVGSDQVWRPCYSPCITDYFLKEVPPMSKVKRIAYAASFGTDIWEFSPEDTEICSSLLKHFDAISVREKSGVSLCKEYFGVNAIHLLDPTMLLDVDDYLSLVKKTKVSQSPGNAFCYILDENSEITKIISAIKTEGYVPFYAGLDPITSGLSVEQWLKSFSDAELVITDSFHACVFSLIFEKPFVVIKNQTRGISRLESLLHCFGLEVCLVDSYENYEEKKAQMPRSVSVKDKLKEKREESWDFFRTVKLI